MEDQAKHVESEGEYEQQEELVVSIANTIVHECTVMIKSFHAFVAVVTMACSFRSQVFALNANIVQVERFFQHVLKQLNEVLPLGNITRIN